MVKRTESQEQYNINEKARLRLRAEEIARETLADLPVHPEAIPPEEVMRTLHELQVHQIELQMQNDELRRTHAELETLKSRYFDLFDLAPVGYCIISPEGQILETNFTACGLLGATRAELVGKPFSGFVLPQDRDIFYLLIQKLSDTATAQERELRLVRKGGVVFWAHLTVTAIVETDAPMVYRVVLSDITPLKQKEGALQEANRELQWNQQKLEVLFNLLPVGISVLDQDSKIIKHNQALENILDIDEAGLAAKAYRGRKYIRADGTSMPAEEFPSSRVMAGEPLVENIRIGALRDDGSTVWTSVSAVDVPLQDWKVAIATSDITARVQAEMELKTSEEKYRILFDNDLYAVAIVDLEDNRLLEVNQTFANLTGYSPEALIGGMTIDKLSVETEETRAAIMEAKEKESIFIPQRRLRKKDGAGITVEIAVNIAILKGKMVSYAILRDISERIEAEQALRESEEKYRVIFENEIYACCIFDLQNFSFLDVNETFVNLYGYNREELLGGMTIRDVSAEPEASIEASLETDQGGHQFIPLRYHHRKDGTIFPVENVGGAFTWKGQRVMFELIHDISSRLKAELDLALSENRFRGVIDQSSEGISMVNAQGIITRWNSAYERITGIPGSEAVGRYAWDVQVRLVPPEARGLLTLESLRENIFLAIQDPNLPIMGRLGERTIQTPAGEIKFITQSLFPIINDQENSIGVIIHDITPLKQIEQALQRSEAELRKVQNFAHVGGWKYFPPDGRLELSDEFYNLLGVNGNSGAINPKNVIMRAVHSDDRQRLEQNLFPSSEKRAYQTDQEYRFIMPDRSIKTLYFQIGDITSDINGEPTRLVGFAQDISERKRVQNRLELSEKRYREIVERQGEGIYIMDQVGQFTFANPAAEDMFGVPPNSLPGRNVKEFCSLEQINIVNQHLALHSDGKDSVYELVITRPDNEIISLVVTATPNQDGDLNLIGSMGIFRDITLRKLTEEKLRKTSMHDALTGLYNRSYYEETVQLMEVFIHYPFSVIVADVDGLKIINDSLGHQAGDRILQSAASILQRSIREDDTLSRTGGDEFVILLPNTDVKSVQQVVRRINQNIAAENKGCIQPYEISISFGWSTTLKEGSLQQGIKKADDRMYKNKVRRRQKKGPSSE